MSIQSLRFGKLFYPSVIQVEKYLESHKKYKPIKPIYEKKHEFKVVLQESSGYSVFRKIKIGNGIHAYITF